LPEIEKSILTRFGYTTEDMNEIAQYLATSPDEYFTSPEKIVESLEIIKGSLNEYIQYIPKKPEPVILGDMYLDDLSIMLDYWLDVNMPSCIGDLDGDCDVDNADLNIFYQHFKDPFEGFEKGNFNKFNWRFYGDEQWEVVTEEPNSGLYCAKSGLIDDYETSTMEIILSCVEGNISFYYKVSSEAYYDYLRFYIDDIEKGSWTGDQDWDIASYITTKGTHTFKWEYIKDGSVSSGEDAGWIDDIVFPM